MNDGAMADRHPFSQKDGNPTRGMHDGAVLDIGGFSNRDRFNIAAQDDHGPDRRMLPDDDPSNDLCGVVDVGAGMDAGDRPLEGTEHYFLISFIKMAFWICRRFSA